MDFAALHDATWRAGFRIDWAALLRLSAHHPEQVQDWVAAAGEYAAADTGQRLLTATAAALRDLIAGSPPEHLYQHADQLSEVCDLLTEADRARDDAMGRLADACHQLAALDRAALIADPDGPAGDPPPALPDPISPVTPAAVVAGGRPCRGIPPRPHKHPRRRRP
jgi:hypothetical protein